MRQRSSVKRQTYQSIGFAVIIVFGSQSAHSDTFIATIEAPGVQDTTSVFFSVGKETFDTRATTSFTSNFSTQVGSFSLVTGISGTVSFASLNTRTSGDFNPPFLYGGAYGTGAYPKDNGIISLNTAVNYFGLWVSAMNGGNTIKIFREQGGAELYSFSLASMTGIVGTASVTNLYYGNPNWLAISGLGSQVFANQAQAAGGEPYAFVNFYDTDGTFKYITIQGGGFESDNWTVGNYSSISGTNPAAVDITASNTTSQVGSVVNPIFAGGTLSPASTSTFSNNFTIKASNGTLASAGFNPTYSGVFSNASGAVGSLTISGTVGSVTLSGVNTYTGSTTVNAGATLALAGNGSLALSGTGAGATGIINNGVFNVSAAARTIVLGKNLTQSSTGSLVMDWNQTISAAGTLNLSGSLSLLNFGNATYALGRYTLISSIGRAGTTFSSLNTSALSSSFDYSLFYDANNVYLDLVAAAPPEPPPPPNIVSTFTTSDVGSIVNPKFDGGTLIAGATSTLSTNFAITAKNGTLASNGFNPTYSGVFSNEPGAVGSLTISGDVGSVSLSGVNTYTGTTSISPGATMLLLGSGSISASRSVCNSGTLNIAGTNSGTSVVDLVCTGNTVLGTKTLTLTGPADTTYGGVVSGSGGLAFTGGIKTLEAVNTYTGATIVASGATLKLTTGSISASSELANTGTFDISGTTSGASLVSITGEGNTVLGSKTLTLTNGSGTYSGTISGTGGLRLVNGSMTLSGINTYSGTTEVGAGANLTLSSASAIGSGLLDLVGTPKVTAMISTTATMTLPNNIRVTDDPTFNVAPGTITTLTGIVSGAGDIVVTGGGALVTTAANTYTLNTTINSGSAFALSGAGSIAFSGTGPLATGVINDGFFIVSAAARTIVLGRNLTQSSTGSLVMDWNQKITAAGTINLGGSLYLLNTGNVSYRPGRYTLVSSTGRAGTFSSLDTRSLSSNYNYGLLYDTNNVYLRIEPPREATQKSLESTASVLKNIFTLQNALLANSFSYDCPLFDKNNACASLGGRMTSVSNSGGLYDYSGSFIGAYRPDPNYRFGVYAEQKLDTKKFGSIVDLDPASSVPLVGLFGVWHERLDGTGSEIKISASYGQTKASVTRPMFLESEPGGGSSQMIRQGAQVTAKYGFGLGQDFIVSPYVGFRFSNYKLNGYNEKDTASVTTPLTFSALSVNAATSLVGVFASYQVDPKIVVYVRGDLESDVTASEGNYSATGVTGLRDIYFNANPVKTRTSGTIGAYYYLQNTERLNLTALYRQEPFQGKPTASIRMSYDKGF